MKRNQYYRPTNMSHMKAKRSHSGAMIIAQIVVIALLFIFAASAKASLISTESGMKDLEFWRINAAVETVIGKHELEIVDEKHFQKVKENPFMMHQYMHERFAGMGLIMGRIRKIKSSNIVSTIGSNA